MKPKVGPVQLQELNVVFILTVVLSVVLAAAFLGAGISKVTAQPMMVESAEHLGFSTDQYKLIGGAELAGAAGLLIGLWFAPLGILAAIGLILLMAGAVFFHLRAGDGPKIFTPSAVLGVLAVIELIFRIASA